ncbi:TetR/AcrR family transcriptional regulator [Ferrovibrio sp.]|uniref:TetR/AcrR family transcriptional regulator n=1 Tax=Ferrovibrio sp. TaxID=1917215 RepID=UPI00260A7BCB|nr:TetR/AcrR family transcriptional regulator [Ferrovibrio sp.]
MARDGTATRTAIMDAAQALILETGFSAASVDAVIARAGITKGTFFYHFKTKADLALALVQRDAAHDAALLEANMARAEALSRDPLQQILICMGLYEEELDKLTAPYPGCLYATFIYEAQLFDDQTLAVARAVFSSWTTRILGKLEAVMKLYRPRLPVDLKTLAEMSLVQAEGAYILSKVQRDPKAVAAQFRHYRNYLELLFAPLDSGAVKPA